jgi:hypothetical protein
VFYTKNQSVIKVYNSLFTNNFAVESSIIRAITSGYFEFYNTTITQNYALSVSIGEIFDVVIPPKLSGCRIYQNHILSKTEFLSEINTQ